MLEHSHVAGPKQWPSDPGRGETLVTGSNHTFAPVESRTINGSARLRLSDGAAFSRPQTELMVQNWHVEKEKLDMEKSRRTRQTSTAIQASLDLHDLDETARWKGLW